MTAREYLLSLEEKLFQLENAIYKLWPYVNL